MVLWVMTPCSLVDVYERQMGHAISILFHEDVSSKFLRNVGNQYNTWASASLWASVPVTYGFLCFVSGFPQLKSSFSTSGSCMTGKHGTQVTSDRIVSYTSWLPYGIS
jgi:hypothetical protein